METNLSKLIRRCLKRQSLTRAEFVRKMGYQNLSKGHQRLTGWLRGVATPSGDQPERIARAAQLALEVVAQAILTDLNDCRENRIARRAQDPNYYLVVRLMPAVYPQYTLPKGITEADALTLARARAKAIHRRCCLNTPDGTNYWIDDKGAVLGADRERPPTMRIGGQRFSLNMG